MIKKENKIPSPIHFWSTGNFPIDKRNLQNSNQCMPFRISQQVTENHDPTVPMHPWNLNFCPNQYRKENHSIFSIRPKNLKPSIYLHLQHASFADYTKPAKFLTNLKQSHFTFPPTYLTSQHQNHKPILSTKKTRSAS